MRSDGKLIQRPEGRDQVRIVSRVIAIAILSGMLAATVGATDEMHALINRLVAVHLKPAAGFTARMLVPPGQLYDPLVMRIHGDVVWLNDDGKEEDGKGSRLISVDAHGEVSVLVD